MKFQKLYIISIFIIIFLGITCCSEKDRIKYSVIQMQENTVVIPFDEMVLAYSDNVNKTYCIQRNNFHLCVYVDSTQCSPCHIDKLFHWNNMIDYTFSLRKKIDYIFIVAPKTSQKEDAYLSIKSCGLKVPIYVDTAYAFSKNNSYILMEEQFHTFLIDKDGKVLIIGNPLYNVKIKKLMSSIISTNS